MTLAEEIIKYRAKHRLNQLEFAKLCGVDRTTIIKSEKGDECSKITEAKIKLVIEQED